MPMVFRATDRTIRELGEGVARDKALMPAAKDRLMKFLTTLDKELPKVHEKASAQITLEALTPHLERLHAVLDEAPLPDAPTPSDLAGMVDRVALIIQTARDGRKTEAEALIAFNAFDPSDTTHGNVMRLIARLRARAQEKSNDGKHKGHARTRPGHPGNESVDAGDGAGRSDRGEGAPGSRGSEDVTEDAGRDEVGAKS